ncbi:hypothetical protein SKAU_G00340490 [Synaphobranchus kaupii]|uniref:Uncharacterized protein n=1 Tax=Synaphobranchus kaupii TaxID=118154 RepID=A0A9Q1IH74_SYNKA|nr:hypothetical protein SKAU_G00340490 [Synaphobranchus kaupii]
MDSTDSGRIQSTLDRHGVILVHQQTRLDSKPPNTRSLLSASLLVNCLIQVVSVLMDSGADGNFINADLVS